MRWVWSGVLIFGLLLILWSVMDAPQNGTAGTSGDVTTLGEDGTPIPPPDPPPPKR